MDSEDRSTQKDTSSSAVTSSLSDLIARLEKATGPDLELDEQIQAAISGATLEKQADGRNAYHRDGFWISIGKVLPYTSSIDAAMTLVPEGWRVNSGDFSVEGRFAWMLTLAGQPPKHDGRLRRRPALHVWTREDAIHRPLHRGTQSPFPPRNLTSRRRFENG